MDEGVRSSTDEVNRLMKQLARESRLSLAFTGLAVVLGVLGLFAAYLTQTLLVLLVTAIAVMLIVMLVAIVSSSESDESLWMRKVTAANKLRDIFLIYKRDYSEATPFMGQTYRGCLETAYGQAVVAGKQSAVDYFKRLIDEYDSTLSRD